VRMHAGQVLYRRNHRAESDRTDPGLAMAERVCKEGLFVGDQQIVLEQAV